MRTSLKRYYKIATVSLFFLSNLFTCNGQEYVSGLLWVNIADSSANALSDSTSLNSNLNEFFSDFNVYSYKQIMSFAKDPSLRAVYEIKCHCNEDSLKAQLNNNLGNLFSNIEKRAKPIMNFDPANYYWGQWKLYESTNGAQGSSAMWYLAKIQADKAWDITLGDPNLQIAIIDDGLYYEYTDPNCVPGSGESCEQSPGITGKVIPAWDFYPYNYSGYSSTNPGFYNTGTNYSGFGSAGVHGTSVVNLLAGISCETDAQCAALSVPSIFPSIGFNCNVMFSSFNSGDGVSECVYASTVLNAKILSISWYSNCCPSPNDLAAEQEILNNGTVIFRAAGNNGPGTGYSSDCEAMNVPGVLDCGGSLLYPFSGLEDDRTIVVSSTDIDDNHNDINPGTYPANSQYPQVSICAPGYQIFSAQPAGNTWPYWGGWGGTSQSTPIAAGVGALMLSVNPCLGPASIKSIIQQTADPIADAASYPGLVGAGRINAYKAVLGAFFPSDVPAIVSASSSIAFSQGTDLTVNGALSNNFYSAVDDITSNATAGQGTIVAFQAGTEIDLTPGFEASQGSLFHAFINHSPCAPSLQLPRLSNSSAQSQNTNGINTQFSLFSVYPNPNNGAFNVTFLSNLSAQNNLEVYDRIGKQVFSKSQITESIIELSLAEYGKGIYLVRLVNNDKSYTARVVVE